MLQEEDRKIALIEAALYASGKPLSLKALASILDGKSLKEAKKLVEALIKRYEEYKGAIQILKLKDERFMMRLKPEYLHKVRKFCGKKILSLGPLKTLSFIAYKQPVSKAYVAKVRGKHAYNHVKILKELGFIHEEKTGKTKLLKTTTAFADAFNLDYDIKNMKKQLMKMFSELNQKQLEQKI
ncbi:SMC-Scp complex subunit ScpB [Candidatus Bathyarchaeota archaeon]|nr:SMC-Scp complex subunit ScpB [Candidatus Bathyarchaeota archaeon]